MTDDWGGWPDGPDGPDGDIADLGDAAVDEAVPADPLGPDPRPVDGLDDGLGYSPELGYSPDEPGYGPDDDAADVAGDQPLPDDQPLVDEPVLDDRPSPEEVGLPADGGAGAGPPEADGAVGFGPAGHATGEESAGEDGTSGFGPADDPPVGTDPDLSPHGDDAGWSGAEFPEPVELPNPPEPVDGFPWTDPAHLGADGAVLPDLAAEVSAAPPPDDLFAYAGEDPPADGAGWAALADSPDPATQALARWWRPGG